MLVVDLHLVVISLKQTREFSGENSVMFMIAERFDHFVARCFMLLLILIDSITVFVQVLVHHNLLLLPMLASLSNTLPFLDHGY